jgi:uncharacterized protein YjiS (DUF1127 family)
MMDTMEAILENVSLEPVAKTETPFRNRVAKLVSAIRWAVTRNRSRMALADLTDAQLADIGISRHEAEREARRFDLF